MVRLKGRPHVMKKLNNELDNFTLRSRISINCMYITTGGNETRRVSVTSQEPVATVQEVSNEAFADFFFTNWT